MCGCGSYTEEVDELDELTGVSLVKKIDALIDRLSLKVALGIESLGNRLNDLALDIVFNINYKR